MNAVSSRVEGSFSEEVLATVPEGIISLDEEGKIVFATPQIESLLGYEPEELVDLSLEQLTTTDGEETPLFDSVRRQATTAGHPPEHDEIHLVLNHKDGHEVAIALSAKATTYDEQRFFNATLRNLSDQKDRKEAFEGVKTLFQKTLEYSPDPLMIVDLRTDEIKQCNAHICDLLGYDRQTLLGSSPSDFLPEEMNEFGEFVETSLIKGDDWTDDLDIRTASGEVRPVAVYGTPFEIEDDRHVLVRIDEITDDREIEHGYRVTRELFRKAFEYSNDAIFLIDPGADAFKDVNYRACELLGYEREELLAMGPSDVHPHELDTFYQFIDEVVEEGNGRTDELSCYTCNGEIVPAQISMARIDFESEPHILASVRDISERKEREEELEQYETIVKTIGDGVYTFDKDLRFRIVNQGMANLTGYSKSDLVGMHLKQLLVGEVVSRDPAEYTDYFSGDRHVVVDMESAKEARRKLRQSDRDLMIVECPIVTADDEVVPCEVRFSTLPTDEAKSYEGTAGVIIDISDRIEWEQQLREERNRLSALFENTTDPVVEFSYDGETPIIESVNSSFEETFGYDATEVKGRPAPNVLVPDRNDEPSTHERLAKQVLHGQRMEEEVERKTAHGSRQFLLRAIPISTSEDTPGGYAIFTDITEREKHKLRLEELHEATQTLMEAETPDEVASVVVETAADVLDCTQTGVHLLDQEAGGLAPAAWTDDLAQVLGGEPPTFGRGQGLAWDTFETGEANYYPDLVDAKDPYNPETDLRSELQIPLGEHGIVILASTVPEAFNETQLELAQVLAAKTEARLDRIESEERLEILSEVSRELLDTGDETDLASATVDIVEQVFDRSLVAIWSYHEDQERLVPINATEEAQEFSAADAPEVRPIPSDSAEMQIFHEGESALIEDYQSIENAAHPDTPLRTVLVLPIGSHGLLTIGFTTVTEIDASERELLETLTRNVQAAFDRLDREREIRRRSTAIEAATDGIGILDNSGEYVYVNEAYADIHGYDAPERLLNGSWQQLYEEDEMERLKKDITQAVEEQGHWRGEVVGQRADGTTFPQELSLAALEDDGLVCVVRDITERKEYEQRLKALNGVNREMAQAETVDEVAQTGLEAGKQIIGIDIGCVRLFDAETNTLEPVAMTDQAEALITSKPGFDLEKTIAGRAFRQTERIHSVLDDEDYTFDEPTVETSLHLPLAEYGVLTISAQDTDGFDDLEIALAEALAVSIRAAIGRATREEELRANEQALRQQHDQLDTLHRITRLVQEIGDNLLETTSREDIEETICKRVAASELFQSAWIAAVRPTADRVDIRTGVGVDEDYLEALNELPLDMLGHGTVTQAIETGELQVVRQYQADDSDRDPDADDSEQRVEVTAAVPLAYGDRVHGVLVVNGWREDVFSENALAGFESLGRLAGFAITALKTREILLSDSVVELELTVTDQDVFYLRVSQELECRLQFDRSVPLEEGKTMNYHLVEGAEPARVLDVAEETDHIEDAQVVSEREKGFVLQTVTGLSLSQRALQTGASVQSAVAEDGQAQVTLEAPQSTDIREVIEVLEKTFSDVDLVAKRERERTKQTATEFREHVDEQLTEKQRATFEAAYAGGYFEWPREVTAEELAESMGVSSSTLHQHLRNAIRSLATAFFEKPHRESAAAEH